MSLLISKILAPVLAPKSHLVVILCPMLVDREDFPVRGTSAREDFYVLWESQCDIEGEEWDTPNADIKWTWGGIHRAGHFSTPTV